MFGLAVEPKARGDEQKISGSLHKIADEDPTFKVTRDAQTKELVITGMSQLHLDVMQHRLKRRFDLEIITHEPKIPYRETITANGEGEHRHKKQSGGRGQFGEVHLRVYPLPREITTQGAVLEEFANKSQVREAPRRAATTTRTTTSRFIDTIVGGTIPNQFMPAVREGLQGAAGARRPGRLPHPGRGRRGLLRQGPRRGQLGSGVQDGRPASPSRTRSWPPSRCCWSRSSTWR